MADMKIVVEEKKCSKVRDWFREHRSGLVVAGGVLVLTGIAAGICGGLYVIGHNDGYLAGHADGVLEGLEKGKEATLWSFFQDIAKLKCNPDNPNGWDLLAFHDEVANVPLPEEALKELAEKGYTPEQASMVICALKDTP